MCFRKLSEIQKFSFELLLLPNNENMREIRLEIKTFELFGNLRDNRLEWKQFHKNMTKVLKKSERN